MSYQIETKYKEGDILVPYSRNECLLVVRAYIGGGIDRRGNSYTSEEYGVCKFDLLDEAINFNYLNGNYKNHHSCYVLVQYIEDYTSEPPFIIHEERNIYADFKEL